MAKTLLISLFLVSSILAFGMNELSAPYPVDPPKVSVFPNPTSQFFSVSETKGISKLGVFNLVGKEMRSFQAVEGEKYNIGDLPNGMYLIQLFDNDKKIVSTLRLQKR